MSRLIYFLPTILLLNFIHAQDGTPEICEEAPAAAFDCGGKGTFMLYKDSEGNCNYGCKTGGRFLSCEEVHPPPRTRKYQRAACEGAVAFDCGTEADPKWLEYDGECNFYCTKSDMKFDCAQIHPSQKH